MQNDMLYSLPLVMSIDRPLRSIRQGVIGSDHAASPCCGTDNGRARDHNEDAFQIEDKPARADAGALFVICDGMGGFASGEVASEIASETIIAQYYATAPLPAW